MLYDERIEDEDVKLTLSSNGNIPSVDDIYDIVMENGATDCKIDDRRRSESKPICVEYPWEANPNIASVQDLIEKTIETHSLDLNPERVKTQLHSKLTDSSGCVIDYDAEQLADSLEETIRELQTDDQFHS